MRLVSRRVAGPLQADDFFVSSEASAAQSGKTREIKLKAPIDNSLRTGPGYSQRAHPGRVSNVFL
jgi:hypothetical protein